MSQRVFCVVIGVGWPFSVMVRFDENVDKLIEAIALRQKYTFHDSQIDLYVAKKDGEWLSNNDPSILPLAGTESSERKRGSYIDPSIWMDPTEKINNYLANPPRKGYIHVIVELNIKNAAKIRRIEASEKEIQDFDLNQIVNIDTLTVGNLFKVTGLDVAGLSDDAEKVLYCRQDMPILIQALETMVGGVRINGPPGVGNSTTVWLWTCNQVKTKKKKVLWIHLEGSVKKILRLTPYGIFHIVHLDDYIAEYVDEVDFVVVDGVTHRQTDMDFDSNVLRGSAWYERPLISVCSNCAQIKYHHLSLYGISPFTANPWSIGEYYQAIKYNEFFNDIQRFLVVDTPTFETYDDLSSRMALVDQKYFYAGRSAGWMFATHISKIIQDVNEHFNNEKEGWQKFNHFSASDRDHESDDVFVSLYVGKVILEKFGKKPFQGYSCIVACKEPSFYRMTVTMDFIQQIKNNKGSTLPVELVNRSAIINPVEISDYVDCDVDFAHSIKEITEKYNSIDALNDVWFLSKTWHQQGFDLACLQRRCEREICTNIMRFIHVTRSKARGLNIKYIRRFAMNFSQATNGEIEGIEIIIAIPSRKHVLNTSWLEKEEKESTDKIVESYITWDTTETNEDVKFVTFNLSPGFLR